MQFNLADLFETVADAVPEREAVVCGGRRFTFAQLDERANRLAHHLAASGVHEGDHVGLYLYNEPEYVEGVLAVLKIRAVPINVNYRYAEDELRHLFDDADLVGVVYQREFGPRVAAVARDLPALHVFVTVDDGSTSDCTLSGAVEYEASLARSSPARDFSSRSGDDLYILYTGGTTGLPKGVMWRQEDLFFAALMGGNPYGAPPERPEQVGENAAARPPMTVLAAGPLIHASGLWAALIALYSGGKVVLLRDHRFDPAHVWQLVQDEGVNSLAIVGDAMARPLAEAVAAPGARYDTSSLFVIGSGGAAFSQSVKQELRARLPNVMLLDSVGSSENGNQGRAPATASSNATGLRFQADETTGVLDEHLRRIVPGSGVVGMLARRGRIPLGYYKDPERSAKTFVEVDGERWAVVGDLATIEADGSVTFLGRESSCINSGGEKVFPEEVEAVLKSHPAVFDAVVVGAPDERWGEVVTAIVQPRPGCAVTVDDLSRHCRSKIAGYKAPRALHLVEEVVRQPGGKPDYSWAKGVVLG